VTLAPGTRIGPYDVTAKLGEGGPPSLARETSASFGVSAVAQARICQ
jgi:hypothetical protein